MERFFASRGIEPRVELTMFAPVGFLRWLAERGFVLQEFENTLVLPLAGLGDPRALLPGGWPEGLRIEHIDPRDDAQVDTFVRTSASGFVPDGERLPDEYLRTGIRGARTPEHDSYVAYLRGEVAGAGGCGTRHGVTSLFGTSVHPRFRRRGVQQALMAVRLGRAFALGSDLADVTSHPGIPTERNATRLGFRLSADPSAPTGTDCGSGSTDALGAAAGVQPVAGLNRRRAPRIRAFSRSASRVLTALRAESESRRCSVACAIW